MNEQEIIALIQARIDSASRNELASMRELLQAQNEQERVGAVALGQISTGQRVVLQGLLDEITGADNQE